MTSQSFGGLFEDGGAAVRSQPLATVERRDFVEGFWFRLPESARGLALQDDAGNVACLEDVSVRGRDVLVRPGLRAQVDGSRCVAHHWKGAHVVWKPSS